MLDIELKQGYLRTGCTLLLISQVIEVIVFMVYVSLFLHGKVNAI